jgi:hypothetical protein
MPKRNAADLLKLEIGIHLQDLQRRRNGVASLNLDEASAVELNLTHLLSIAESYDRDVAGIRGDPDLTDHGKRKAIEKVGRSTLQKISDFEQSNVTKPRERAATLGAQFLGKAEIKRPTDMGQFMVYLAQMQSLWARFSEADPLEVDLIALTSTDPLVLDALQTAPPVLRRPDKHSPLTLMPIVNPERIAAATLERARVKDPEGAAQLEKIERTTNCYAGSIGGVKAAIIEQVGTLADDPVAEQARGRQHA